MQRSLTEPGILGIIGNPVSASLSPAMQNAALRSLKLDACYRAFEIAPADVRAVLRALPLLGFWGINVTIPYKEKVLPYLDEVDAVASAIGAVNTVVVRDGRRLGYNTDAEGFRMALEIEGRTELPGAQVLVVGAGGAARAAAFACLSRGCRSLLIANRSEARARSLCRALRLNFPAADIAAVATGGPDWSGRACACGVVVNTTPLAADRTISCRSLPQRCDGARRSWTSSTVPAAPRCSSRPKPPAPGPSTACRCSCIRVRWPSRSGPVGKRRPASCAARSGSRPQALNGA
jgi:shikimate dehydrogenase